MTKQHQHNGPGSHRYRSLSSAFADSCLVERGAQSVGELHGVTVGPEVHEDQPRLLAG
jgi:hypothetical protein